MMKLFISLALLPY